MTGATGAVGGFAVQLARLRGLRVVAPAAPADEQLLHALGVEIVVPRSATPARDVRAAVPGGVDGALDAARLGAAALDAVANRGAFVAVAAGTAPPPLRGTRVQNVWIQHDGARLAELVRLVDEGRLALPVEKTMPLEDVARAHERLAAGGLRGRLVLVP